MRLRLSRAEARALATLAEAARGGQGAGELGYRLGAAEGRAAILLRGVIAAIGSPYDLTATGAGLTKISVQSEGDSLANGQSFVGVQQQSVKDNHMVYYSATPARTVSALLEHLEHHNDSLIDLRVERPSLEERFLEITQTAEVAK